MNVIRRAAFLTLVILIATSGAAAFGLTPTPVLDDPDVREYGLAASDGYLVWSESDETGWNSFVKSLSGEIVRMGRTIGNSLWSTIDGTTAMYTRLRPDRHFELRFYDVHSEESSAPPAGVNTRFSEEDPSLSGEWLLFTRRTAFGHPRDDRVARVILFNLSTWEHRVLMRLGTKRHSLTTGQVSGDWATWETCDGRIASGGPWSNCQVHRYRISTQETEVLPNAGSQQYGAGVTSDGTAYLGRAGWSSAWHCGANVRIVRVSPSGATDVIERLPSGIDTGGTFALEEADGSTTLYLDWLTCRTGGSDVYRIDVPASETER